MRMFRDIQKRVFWPSFGLLIFSVTAAVYSKSEFLEAARAINSGILENFDWLFSWSTFVFLLICLAVYFSPIGKKRIGGEQAVPILSKWRWFSITLCTTIATGILFWGTAEPLYHFNAPPEGLNIEPQTESAAEFAMSTMFLHWTFTPYGIYTLAGLTFALCYYNLKQPFSLGAVLFPLTGKRTYGIWSTIINNICIFALVAGMSASLGAGIITLSGGLNNLFGLNQNAWLWLLICLFIVFAFVLSAYSGLQRGIRVLSDYNIKAFFILAIVVFLISPWSEILSLGWEGFKEYVSTFFSRSTGIGNNIEKDWNHGWTSFYWANWMAWAPVTAMFLGRISKGYTVREFIRINLFYTGLFGLIWMVIFSGSTLIMEQNNGHLSGILDSEGPGNVIYGLLNGLGTQFMGFVFLIIAFLSYVTAADSNTSALGGISTKGISADHEESSPYIKIVWGITIGVMAYIMITLADVEGIKIISTIGGLPAMILLIVIAVSLLHLAFFGGRKRL